MPAQKHTPYKESVGDHSLVIGDSRREVGLVGSQCRVWTHAGQVHKKVRHPQQVNMRVRVPPWEIKGWSTVVGVRLEHANNMVKVRVAVLD